MIYSLGATEALSTKVLLILTSIYSIYTVLLGAQTILEIYNYGNVFPSPIKLFDILLIVLSTLLDPILVDLFVTPSSIEHDRFRL